MTHTTIKSKEQELIKMVPFWVVRGREVQFVDLYESQLFWIDEEGFASFHFTIVSPLSANTMNVYKTKDEATRAWQKEMRKFYDENYNIYLEMVKELDTFKIENAEVFI